VSNVNDYFPSKWLKAADLKGKEPVVIIREIAYEPVGQKREMKPVVYFRGQEKGLVLNRTNANRIIQIAGSADTDEWVGVSIKLYATEVEFQGQLMDGLRVKPPQASKQNPLRPAADTFNDAVEKTVREVGDDDVPF